MAKKSGKEKVSAKKRSKEKVSGTYIALAPITPRTVPVNTIAAYQKDAYFRRELSVTNSTDPVLQAITIEADLSSTIYDEGQRKGVRYAL